MTDAEPTAPIESERYREMASDIRALVPMLKHTEAAKDLCSLAARYERLAVYLETAIADHKEGRLRALRELANQCRKGLP